MPTASCPVSRCTFEPCGPLVNLRPTLVRVVWPEPSADDVARSKGMATEKRLRRGARNLGLAARGALRVVGVPR